jgi:hypothetical protein
MRVELHRRPKPENVRKIRNFSTEKITPYTGFKPRTSGLAVGSVVLTTAPLGRFTGLV